MTRRDLQADHAATLVPPGAETISTHQGTEHRITIGGAKLADDTSLYRTHEESEKIVAYYAAELSRLGWTSPYRAFRTTAEIAARAWCKDRIEFRLGIRDRGHAPNASLFAEGHRTVFEVSLAGRDTKIPCPSQ